MCSRKPLTPDVILDETWFSDPVTFEESKLWYMLSKTLAEESAWKFTKENGIGMIIMNPGLIIGPLLQSTTTFSVDTILNLIIGSYSSCDGNYRFVDIRDVANAHIQAFETEATRPEDDKPSVPTFKVSQEKARSLGINFIPLEVSLKDMIESLKERGLLIF